MIDHAFDMSARLRADTAPAEQRRQAERRSWQMPTQRQAQRWGDHAFGIVMALAALCVIIAFVAGVVLLVGRVL